MAYVTYFHGRPPGLPAASTWRRVARTYATQAEADARAGEALQSETNYTGAVSDDVDSGWWIQTGGPTAGTVAAKLPANAIPAADARTASWRLRLHRAWRAYCDGAAHPGTARQDWWVRVGGSDDALTATDRWAFSQIALGDLLAQGNLGALNTVAKREAALAHVETAVSTLGAAWYGVMTGNQARRDDWRTGAVADGARIYSDLFTAGLAIRQADGAWTAMPATARIAAGFNPDSPTLR